MFSGTLVAMVTPMQTDGALDLAAWERLLELHVTSDSSGVVVGGTTGESATLTDAEIWTLAERACAQLRRRIPVIVGVGTSGTASTIERARRFAELPIDALLVVTPAYNRPTQQGLYEHFAAVARATRVPLILYNVPSRTAVDLLPATIGRLSQLPGIVAVKEAVAEPERMLQLAALARADFAILSGDDATACRSILQGARGVISVTANVAPQLMAAMVQAALNGDRERAEALDARLAGLHRDLFLESNPIPVKWALNRMGLLRNGIRLPLTEFSPQHHGALIASLRAAGIVVH